VRTRARFSSSDSADTKVLGSLRNRDNCGCTSALPKPVIRRNAVLSTLQKREVNSNILMLYLLWYYSQTPGSLRNRDNCGCTSALSKPVIRRNALLSTLQKREVNSNILMLNLLWYYSQTLLQASSRWMKETATQQRRQLYTYCHL